MDKRAQCELVEVTFKDDNQRAILTFLDEEKGEVLEVSFNKNVYKDGEFLPDDEKAKKVDEWCDTYFGLAFDNLDQAVGERKDIYVYNNFNSLWESKETKKFSPEDRGKFFQTEIERVVDDGNGIHIYFLYEDDEYESKMMYSDYIENLKKWFVNPQKKTKQRARFKNLFGIEVEDADQIIGKPINVEVKVAFKKHAYCEIKKPDWA
jgi:hypothetical protein